MTFNPTDRPTDSLSSLSPSLSVMRYGARTRLLHACVCIHEKHLSKGCNFSYFQPSAGVLGEESEASASHFFEEGRKNEGVVRSNRSNGTARPSPFWRREEAVAERFLDVYNKNISRGVECRRGRKNSSVFAALFTLARPFIRCVKRASKGGRCIFLCVLRL